MNPFGPFGAIGSLAGAGMALFGGHHVPQYKDYNSLFGTDAVNKRRNDFFAMLASSPAFRQALAQTNIGSQQASQSIDKNLAAAGLTGSGVGAIGSALGQAAGGFNRANLIGGLGSDALKGALDINSLLAGLYQNFEGQRASQTSPLQNLGGSLLGALGPSFLKTNRRAIGGGTFSNPFGMGEIGGAGYMPNPMSGF